MAVTVLTAALPFFATLGLLGLTKVPLSITTTLLPTLSGMVAIFAVAPIIDLIRLGMGEAPFGRAALKKAVATAMPSLLAYTLTFTLGAGLPRGVALSRHRSGGHLARQLGHSNLRRDVALPASFCPHPDHRRKRLDDTLRSSRRYDLAS